MEKILKYLELIPLYWIVLALAAGGLFFFLLPAKWRLPLILFGLGPWVTLSNLPELGAIRSLTKIGLGPYFLLLTAAAVIHPSPKKALPPIAAIYLFGAAISFSYVWNLVDFFDTLIICVQWLSMTLATLALVRCMYDGKSVCNIINILFSGVCISILIPFAAFFIPDGVTTFTNGRYTPYDIHPNFLGQIFIYGIPWAIYQAVKAKHFVLRIFLIFSAALGLFQIYITFSRGSLLCLLLPLSIAAIQLFKSKRLLLLLAALITGAVLFQSYTNQETSHDRLLSLKTKRYEVFSSYKSVIRARPITGLMFSENEKYMRSEDALMQPHNAYILLLYFGGLSYSFIYFSIMAVSMLSIAHLLRHHRLIKNSLVYLLIMSLLATYLHGMVEIDIFRAISLYAFMNLFLSLTVVRLAQNPEVIP